MFIARDVGDFANQHSFTDHTPSNTYLLLRHEWVVILQYRSC